MREGERGHPIFAAFFDRMSRSAEKRGMAELRRDLLSSARGTVVEIGAGTGRNFSHYPAAVTEVVAIEPDPNMLKRARPAAEEAPVKVRVEQATAERLSLDDDVADTVVATLVFCTIPDPAGALAEIRRVLKPEGRFLFLEHVRAQQRRLAAWQDRLQPVWSAFGGGCHPNRDTPAEIERAGFRLERVERFDFSPNLLLDRPHARGVAVPS
ncbi:MAG: class I SAM-dependent methyltransferase [Actinomycetota bacterium]